MTSLEGWSSTIELRPRRTLRLSRGHRAPSLDGPRRPEDVGAPGFEPGTSCSQSRSRSWGLTSLTEFAQVRIGAASVLVRSGEAI